jgi:prevent-host-death family protein
MRTINIHEAKTHLSRFVEQAAAGEEIIIAKAGKPVARLVPLKSMPSRRNLGIFKGKLNIPDDFDTPLPDEVIAQFENSSIEPSP